MRSVYERSMYRVYVPTFLVLTLVALMLAWFWKENVPGLSVSRGFWFIWSFLTAGNVTFIVIEEVRYRFVTQARWYEPPLWVMAFGVFAAAVAGVCGVPETLTFAGLVFYFGSFVANSMVIFPALIIEDLWTLRRVRRAR